MSWRPKTALLTGLLALVGAACAQAEPLTGTTRGSIQPPDPARNIPIDWNTTPTACDSDPQGAECERFAVAQLDTSRAATGLPPYHLPAGFFDLSPASQVLVLTNLDRKAYRLAPVGGLDTRLNGAAGKAASIGADPAPPTALSANGSEAGYASNWAGGMPNILLAYDLWMYDDGYGSGNLDCTTPSSENCWGHRHDVFAFPTLATTMGVAQGRYQGYPSFTQLIVATFPRS